MGKGYMGKILMVDLSTGEIKEEIIPDEVYRELTSGMGLAAWLLYSRIPKDADPYGPDNIFGFVTGLLTGSGAWFTGRWMVVGKSPLTGGWGDANCGGTLAPAIKRSGYDGVFFKGISPRPVYLKVVDGKAELKDASHLWGLDAVEAEEKITEEVGEKNVRVATIGQAGENKSCIAGVVNDKGRVAARSGLGGVMGAKKLKGVAFAGKTKIEVQDAAMVKKLNAEFMKWFNMGQKAGGLFHGAAFALTGKLLRISPIGMGTPGDMAKIALNRFGTIVTNVLSSENGDSPIKNWKGVGFQDFPISSHAGNLHPHHITKYQVKKYHCYNCPLGCGGILKVKEKGVDLPETHKPEYETCCAFGALMLNKDLGSIIRINDYLNRAGMDTISAGATISWAMECYENGILTKEDLDGLDLNWGNVEAIEKLLEKMVKREGIGDLLADGTKKAAEKIGKGSENFAIHAGGQELPMHDSRFDPGFALSYALEPTPGRHTNHGYQWLDLFDMHRLYPWLPKVSLFFRVKEKYEPEGKEDLLIAASKYMQFANGVGACLFGVQMGGHLNLPAYTNATTGWTYTPEDYLKIGERIQNLRQAFNVKHGLKPRQSFKLPDRVVGKPALTAGPMKGITLDMDRLYNGYLKKLGWDKDTAAPTKEKLTSLGLEEAAKELYPA